ncbi:MAG TPA: HesA/MoeB/ThiF family protein [Candidatus Competibacteraceae bacterium]|nr:HesA/MoeB/ThiF family protein [Candidatus Competibacteraceae bacterium]
MSAVRLAAARVLVLGVGGLGCPAAAALAAAGVGRLHLVDDDVVELSNLQRQILFRSDQLGRPKAEAARDNLLRRWPMLQIEAAARRLEGAELRAQLADVDVVLDCTDNIASRHALNQVCRDTGRPWVSAAAVGWQGQILVLDPRRGDLPCYRCAFPFDALPAGSCVTQGVIGPLLGVLGAMQALQALRLLVDGVSPLSGRLLRYDALRGSWRSYALARDPHCPVCGSAEQPSASVLM